MSCAEMEFMIQRYYDGELVTEEESLLQAHLHTCQSCDQEFREFGTLFGDIGALRLQVEHRDILSRTLERLEEAQLKRQSDRWYRGVAVAAAVLVVVSTALVSWTDSGQAMKHRVSAFFAQQTQTQPLMKVEVPPTHVEHDPQQAQAALENIYAQVQFPLMELTDPRLQVESTSLTGVDADQMYQMVELEYRLVGKQAGESDLVHFLATPDNSLKSRAKSNLGTYEFKGEVQAGAFRWAKVGEHAITAEINEVYYQLFSPFLSTQDLLEMAKSIQKR
ncbi:anti-sigma factor family protein [Tumebacillus permanentifrigoris]|uniref:Putative zinc finger protein n=1 Tax=Tumebacillus permanentifrigoris TaxID=378543 RepID=A0A316DA58_9BACL|nr:zf-HC2 domain-containing protein [Tumebacillus permanentifrigoris]PWK13124.1 putative zinc finger protein [Tumebacillus permanentifrigoris]